MSELDAALDWCASTLGSVTVLDDHSKEHGGHKSTIHRLRVPGGFAYLKIHHTLAHWQNEVHAYEHWAPAFGSCAPRLLAVHDQEPLALVISELPGTILEHTHLPPEQERAAWRQAGAALPPLHDLDPGNGFGPCRRDGSGQPDSGNAEDRPTDAVEAISQRLKSQIDQAVRGAYIDKAELAVLQAASELLPAFAGERPTPCHRDYCAANWLVDSRGVWVGVIDFEFSYWDVRVADFSRDPDWAWVVRPDLEAAFLEGYGQPFTARERQQLHVARAEYALSAIVWGRDNAFYGFEREGRAALAKLGRDGLPK